MWRWRLLQIVLKHIGTPRLAILNAARIARAAGKLEDAAQWLSTGHKLKGDETTKHNIQYEENLVARARAVAGSPEALPEDFIVYVCQKCGRLIEYVSLPCMCCGWRPTTLFERSHSVSLNNRIFSLWDLLVIGREIALQDERQRMLSQN